MSLRAAELEGPAAKQALATANQQEAEKLLQLERQLHHGSSGNPNSDSPLGLDRWSIKHATEVPRVGALPYDREKYKDQRISVASREITRLAIYLPEVAYLRAVKKIHAKVVGSKDTAAAIIEGFAATQAFPEGEDSRSITDLAIENLQEGISFGLTSGHPDRLSDIGEFIEGLNLSVADREGKKYLRNFRILINKNMTRESFVVFKGIKIPIANLVAMGLGSYWGLPPGESSAENGIPIEVETKVNALFMQQYLRDRKLGAVALGFVPTGSRMLRFTNDESAQLERLMFRDHSYTASLLTRCDGGIITANRFGKEDFEVGPVVSTRGPGGERKNRSVLADEVIDTNARQIARLSGVEVEYVALSEEKGGNIIKVSPI